MGYAWRRGITSRLQPPAIALCDHLVIVTLSAKPYSMLPHGKMRYLTGSAIVHINWSRVV